MAAVTVDKYELQLNAPKNCHWNSSVAVTSFEGSLQKAQTQNKLPILSSLQAPFIKKHIHLKVEKGMNINMTIFVDSVWFSCLW
jgi:hypothetical protein